MTGYSERCFDQSSIKTGLQGKRKGGNGGFRIVQRASPRSETHSLLGAISGKGGDDLVSVMTRALVGPGASRGKTVKE